MRGLSGLAAWARGTYGWWVWAWTVAADRSYISLLLAYLVADDELSQQRHSPMHQRGHHRAPEQHGAASLVESKVRALGFWSVEEEGARPCERKFGMHAELPCFRLQGAAGHHQRRRHL